MSFGFIRIGNGRPLSDLLADVLSNEKMEVNIERQFLYLDGRRVDAGNYKLWSTEIMNDENPALADVFRFLESWFDGSLTVTVRTSGSTGAPKTLVVRKEQMVQSARITCGYLHLQERDTALLCMNLRYIGAMMVVVRALVAGLELLVREPSGHPLAELATPVRFASMVPLQVYNSLQVRQEKERLKQIGTLLIGGGAVDEALENQLRDFPGAVYSTYGMTETLSHIALRRLSGVEASECYYPFPSVRLSLSAENTLVIDAPLVCDEVLTTNDIARIRPDGGFFILGRKDNIINSGGIKIQPEEVEKKLRPFIRAPFAVTSVPDKRLGEALVLLVEGSGGRLEACPDWLAQLPPYHRPKRIRYVKELPGAGNGKVDRAGCRRLAHALFASNGADEAQRAE